MLEMRKTCDRCGVSVDAEAAGAWICSYECTYCADCARALDLLCPGCGGELMERPVRPDKLRA